MPRTLIRPDPVISGSRYVASISEMRAQRAQSCTIIGSFNERTRFADAVSIAKFQLSVPVSENSWHLNSGVNAANGLQRGSPDLVICHTGPRESTTIRGDGGLQRERMQGTGWYGVENRVQDRKKLRRLGSFTDISRTAATILSVQGTKVTSPLTIPRSVIPVVGILRRRVEGEESSGIEP